MHDNALLRLAIGLSLLGIVTLYFLQPYLLPPLETGNDWNSQDAGKLIRTQGVVVKTWNQGNETYLFINQSCLVTTVLPEERNLPIGITIEIIGRYNEYGNRKELQAEKIKIIE